MVGPEFVAPAHQPDFDREVLQPLRIAQEQARVEAARRAEEARKAAEAELAALAARQAAERASAAQVQPQAVPTGSHTDWMAAAGIRASDYGYVEYIVDHESGWGITKWNYSGSGAYGLGQALPASKMAPFGGDYMTNPVTQLKWANSYAVSRYGSWASAYQFWIARHWW